MDVALGALIQRVLVHTDNSDSSGICCVTTNLRCVKRPNWLRADDSLDEKLHVDKNKVYVYLVIDVAMTDLVDEFD